MTHDLEQLVTSTGVLAPLLFVLLYVALTVLMVPGSIPSLAAGALLVPSGERC